MKGRLGTPPGTPRSCEAPVLESLVLWVVGFAGDAGVALLEGLAEDRRAEAHCLAAGVLAMGSAARQARAARLFGLREDAALRVRALLPGLGSDLRAAALSALPRWEREPWRPGPPCGEPERGCERVQAWGARLVREVTR